MVQAQIIRRIVSDAEGNEYFYPKVAISDKYLIEIVQQFEGDFEAIFFVKIRVVDLINNVELFKIDRVYQSYVVGEIFIQNDTAIFTMDNYIYILDIENLSAQPIVELMDDHIIIGYYDGIIYTTDNEQIVCYNLEGVVINRYHDVNFYRLPNKNHLMKLGIGLLYLKRSQFQNIPCQLVLLETQHPLLNMPLGINYVDIIGGDTIIYSDVNGNFVFGNFDGTNYQNIDLIVDNDSPPTNEMEIISSQKQRSQIIIWTFPKEAVTPEHTIYPFYYTEYGTPFVGTKSARKIV